MEKIELKGARFKNLTCVLLNSLIFVSVFVLNPGRSLAQPLTGDSWQTIKENGEGAITVSYLPVGKFSYKNEEGELTGVEIDIFKFFLNYMKNSYDVSLSVNWVEAEDNFPEFYNSIVEAREGVFGLGTVSILEKRKKDVLFSPPYINNLVVLVTGDAQSDLNSLKSISQEFSGMKGITVPDTNIDELIQDFKTEYWPELQLVQVQSQLEALEMIKNSPGSYFSFIDLSIFWPEKQNGASIKRHPVADQKGNQFGFIIPKNSDWKPLLDEFFNLGNGFRSMPVYRNILIKHLGSNYAKMLQTARQ